ncbi:serine dehydratase beta chain, partial [Bifidobacterium adolescentis]
MFSILEMFTIGVGPSSSHTVGPMVAASRFAASLERDGILNRVGRVRTVLYGSLALTGLGHGTDRATVAGLEGNVPKTVDTDHMSNIRMECEAGGELMLNGTHRIDFDYGRDVVMDVWH